MDNTTPYGRAFYTSQCKGSKSSAEVVVPAILDLLQPRSVVDVGCGLGVWLAEFASHGVSDLCGIDGYYVDRSRVEVPEEVFLARDLAKPLTLNRQFDLALCLEVAEHLPDPSGQALVRSLAQIAPAVLFSAAIPYQGGTHHINERWQDYWASLFRREEFAPVDYIRPLLWSDSRVDYWYLQNTLLYVAADLVKSNERLAAARDQTHDAMLSLVHPRLYAAQHGKQGAARSRWQRATAKIHERWLIRPQTNA